METIIVEIFLPGINQAFDFAVPSQIPVINFVHELVDAIQVNLHQVRIDNEHPMLCDMRHCVTIPMDKTLAECHVRDSDRLMLI